MADIRIKDLTTTASSTASDDFIAVDGTTNGTRKLNAFSPTFGGNATVAGTLTAASNFSIASTGFYAGGGTPGAGRFLYSATAGSMLCGQGGSTYDLSLASSTGTTILGVPTGTNNVLIPATTASTTTSTGALVVSGGVGVGGAINAAGTITSTASTDSGLLQLNLVNSSTGTSASSLFRFNAGTRTVTLQAYNDTHATLAGQLRVGTSNGDIVVIPSGVTAATFGSNTVSIPLSTASTTTSSGALVVSGGVGVAGAIYAGNVINATVNGGASIIGRNGSASSFTSLAAYSGASDEVKGTLTSSTAGVIIVGSQTNHPLAVYVNNAEVARWDTSANFQTRVTGTAPSLTTNSTMTFELTSNTSLKIFVRGSDGTTRSTTLTLA